MQHLCIIRTLHQHLRPKIFKEGSIEWIWKLQVTSRGCSKENHEPRWKFVDGIESEGEISCNARDVQVIIDSRSSTGLILNTHKSEITAKNFDIIDKFPTFKNFKRVALQDMTLLWVPVLKRRATGRTMTMPWRTRLLHLRDWLIDSQSDKTTTPFVCWRTRLPWYNFFISPGHLLAPSTFYCTSSIWRSKQDLKLSSTCNCPNQNEVKHHCQCAWVIL